MSRGIQRVASERASVAMIHQTMEMSRFFIGLISRWFAIKPSGCLHWDTGTQGRANALSPSRCHPLSTGDRYWGLPAGLARLTARFPRPRFVDRKGAAGQWCAVEGVNGAVRRAAVRHLDEGKATGTTGVTIGHNPGRVDGSIWLEELAEVLLHGGKSQVAHKDIHVASPKERIYPVTRSSALSVDTIRSSRNGQGWSSSS